MVTGRGDMMCDEAVYLFQYNTGACGFTAILVILV